jgi:hypothetical protein
VVLLLDWSALPYWTLLQAPRGRIRASVQIKRLHGYQEGDSRSSNGDCGKHQSAEQFESIFGLAHGLTSLRWDKRDLCILH